MKKKTVGASYRISVEGRRLLRLLASRFGVSMTAVLELMIRKTAKQEGLSRDETEKESQ